EDAGTRRIAVSREHRSRGHKGFRIQVERALHGIGDARAPRVRRHRVDVRQAEAGLREEGVDRTTKMRLDDIWKLAAEDHAKPAVAQLVSQVMSAFRHEDRAGVLQGPAGPAIST